MGHLKRVAYVSGRVAVAVALVLALAGIVLTLFADPAAASHGTYCPDCSWWNVVCRFGNWIDGC